MPRGASVSRTSSAKPTAFVRNVVPDRLDLRDRSYQPAVQVIPKPTMKPICNLPVLCQGDCNGCTGFSLTTVVHHLLHASGRNNSKIRVSLNADAITAMTEAGGIKLYQACQKSPFFKDKGKVRLIGHSAGSILHSHLIHGLGVQGWRFDSVNFMAPAVRVDTFTDKVVPAIKDGRVKHYHQFHLTDAAEQKPELQTDTRLQPLAALSRLAIVRAGQDHANTRHGRIFRREDYRRCPTYAPESRRARNRKASDMAALMMTRRPGKVWWL